MSAVCTSVSGDVFMNSFLTTDNTDSTDNMKKVSLLQSVLSVQSVVQFFHVTSGAAPCIAIEFEERLAECHTEADQEA